MTLFRLHRGSLQESMATCREVNGLFELVEILTANEIGPGKIEIKPYGRDNRIGWDTYIVTVDGNAVGFTNGPVSGDRKP